MEFDWKKIYKDALDTAKFFVECGHLSQEQAEKMFPELRESGDERVRKELLEVIRHCYEDGGYALCTDDYKKYSAYLEKQKEQKPNYCHYGGDPNIERCRCCSAACSGRLAESKDERMEKAIVDALLSHCNSINLLSERGYQIEDVKAWLEKQKECHSDDVLNRTYQNGFEDGFKAGKEVERRNSSDNDFIKPRMQEPWNNEKQKEQKPSDDKAFEDWINGWWKEHKEKAYPQVTMDEKEFKNFCRGIRNMYQQKPADLPPGFYFIDQDGKRYYSKEFRYGDMKMKIVEDKSEKPAERSETKINGEPIPTDNQSVDISLPEWSEEDEKILHSIKQCVYDNVANIGTVDKNRFIDWLESLHPSWKPSEEQMKALQVVVDEHWDVDGDALYSLYTDLKKLI